MLYWHDMSNAEMLGMEERDSEPEVAEESPKPEVQRAITEAEIVAGRREEIEKVQRAVERTEVFAKWMDEHLLDPLIGIVFGVGEGAGAVAGLYIVAEAIKAGVPKGKIRRMLRNIAIDVAIGAVPGSRTNEMQPFLGSILRRT